MLTQFTQNTNSVVMTGGTTAPQNTRAITPGAGNAGALKRRAAAEQAKYAGKSYEEQMDVWRSEYHNASSARVAEIALSQRSEGRRLGMLLPGTYDQMEKMSRDEINSFGEGNWVTTGAAGAYYSLPTRERFVQDEFGWSYYQIDALKGDFRMTVPFAPSEVNELFAVSRGYVDYSQYTTVQEEQAQLAKATKKLEAQNLALQGESAELAKELNLRDP